MSFFSRLESRIRAVDSLLCIGLDPHPEDLPAFTAANARAFCLNLIEETANIAAAYKPNIAFFEALGPEGISALQYVIAVVPDGIPVILDAKRGDIASTATAYAQAAFVTLGASAITINPYLGFDAVAPFIQNPNNGVFLLCKTSNPGASDLQNLTVIPGHHNGPFQPVPLYMQVARLAKSWSTHDNLGLVVGATQPDSLARVRAEVPDLWILAPGVGAQGGNLLAALQAGLRADGLGLLIPVSRGISRSADPQQAAIGFRDTIRQAQAEIRRNPSLVAEARVSDPGASIAKGLLKTGCIKFGRFTLKSGIESPIYIDMRRLVGYPELLAEIALAYIPILQGLDFSHLAALPYAALPITSTISLFSGWSMIYPRKEVKTYGTKAEIEGVFNPGDRVVVIDDLVSTGGSKFEAIDKLRSAGLEVQDVVVLVDRSLDGGAALASQGYRLHAVLNLAKILDIFQLTGEVSMDLIKATRVFLQQ